MQEPKSLEARVAGIEEIFAQLEGEGTFINEKVLNCLIGRLGALEAKPSAPDLSPDLKTIQDEQAKQDEAIKNIQIAVTALTTQLAQIKKELDIDSSVSENLERLERQLAEMKTDIGALVIWLEGFSKNIGQPLANLYRSPDPSLVKKIETMKAVLDNAASLREKYK